MSVEFTRIVPLGDIGEPVERRIDANAAERAAVARRFDLRALDALSGRFIVAAAPGGVRVTGAVTARAAQACVISGEDVPAVIGEPVDLMFLGAADSAGEVELAAGDCDVLPVEGRGIDLGEIAAQTLGLALDPYPRAEAAKLAAARTLLLSEEEAARQAAVKANPFAVLKRGD